MTPNLLLTASADRKTAKQDITTEDRPAHTKFEQKDDLDDGGGASGECTARANLRRHRAIDAQEDREREGGRREERESGIRERSKVNRLQSIPGSSWSRDGRRGVTSSGRNSGNIQLACTRT